ncbi:MAG: hypothetical protein SO361_07730 [Lachnospira sp.]|nr:hypothetical protein [Lachnospira sp.]
MGNEFRKNEKKMEHVFNGKEKEIIDEKKAKRRTLTILGYICFAVVLIAVLPVILAPIFGRHAYLNGTDSTGNISKYGSLVYVKDIDAASFEDGNIVAVSNENKNRTVDVYYVESNDRSNTLTLRTGDIVSYNQVKGKVVAKTPFIGYLSQLAFTVAGIIVLVVLFAAGLALMMYANKISKEINQRVEDQRK